MTGPNDKSKKGLAGELLVAGQLLKLGYLASVTMGNAKAIDLLVHNEKTNRTFPVQVKTMGEKTPGWFMGSFKDDSIYVFVILNGPGQPEEYFVVKGKTLRGNLANFFGEGFNPESPKGFDGVDRKSVEPFRNNWKVFDEAES